MRGTMKALWGATLVVMALPALAQSVHSVRIQARDSEGTPVANAPVIWVLRPDREEVRTALPGEDERSVTDPDGYCTLQLPESPPNQASTFEVWVDGGDGGDGRAAFVRVSPDETLPDPIPVTLTKQVPLRGQVRAEDGTPVEGALIGPQWFPRTTTDAQGRFTLWGMGTWGGTLSIFKEGFAWTVVHNPEGEIDILLEPGFRIEVETVDPSGKPVAGATVYSEGATLITDERGRAAALPRPSGTNLSFFAEVGEGAQRMIAESTRVKVSGEEGQLIRLVLTPYVAPPPVTISGRVTMADTGDPVSAKIFVNNNLQDFDYSADEEGQTAEDGTFTIPNHTGREVYILARPTEGTLYGSDGIVRVDCSAGSVEGLDLKVAPGCALSGRIVLSDGSEPQPDWVILRQGNTTLQSYTDGGQFEFLNLPPAPGAVSLESGSVVLPIALGKAGTALRDVTMNLPGPAAMVHFKGQILNAQGEPQPGFSISLEIKSENAGVNSFSAEADGEGRFVIDTKDSGMVTVAGVYYTRQLNVGEQYTRQQIQCSIVEPIVPFPVEPGASVENLKIVVARPVDWYLAGTIQDEHGAPLKPEIHFLTGAWNSNSPREATGDGYFKFYTLPEERFAIIFELKGHQVRILEEGRNFERGDQELKVVLPTTPYPEDVPMWTTITGAPWTPEAVEQSIQGDPIRQRFGEFTRLLAANAPPATPQPVTPPAPEPTSIAVRVVDASGNPVPRISLHPAACYGYLDTRQTPGPLDFLLAPGAATIVQANPEGRYDIPLNYLIWTDGTCRQWVGGALAKGEVSPRSITLYPARRLTVLVQGHGGDPLSGISLAPYTRQGSLAASGTLYPFPQTDGDGKVVFDGLPPAVYTLIAHLPMQEQAGRLVQADLTRTDDAAVTVDFGIYPVDSGDALLEQLRETWQKARTERSTDSLADLWKKRARKDRKRIQEAATARLAAPVLADIEALPFLAELAATTEMKGSVTDILRQWPYLPRFAVQEGRPVIAAALADLAGNDAMAWFTQATDTALDYTTRLSMIVAMNRIGTAESLAAWRSLRDGARNLPNAPQAKVEYTHEERMVEAMRLVLGYLAGGMPAQPLPAGTAEVDADYNTGRIAMGNSEFRMRRYGDEWVPVEIIGSTGVE